MRIVGLRLLSPQPDELLRFYAETLGLPKSGGGVRAGLTLVTFVQGEPASPLHFAFNIPENRLEDAKAWLAPRARRLARNGTDTFRFDFWNADVLARPSPLVVTVAAARDAVLEPVGTDYRIVARGSIEDT
jgi:hypothetical protein